VLLDCHAEGVIQTAATPVQLHSPLSSFGPVVQITGDDAMTGCFTAPDGKKKILIVPMMPEKTAKVNIQLQNVTKANLWRNNQAAEIQISNQLLEVSVGSGEAVFVEF